MKRWRVRLAFGLLAALALAAVLGMWLLAPPSHRINVDAYHQIDINTSESDVAEILGRPPGSYNRWPLNAERRGWSGWGQKIQRDDMTVEKTFRWVSDDAEITIKLNRGGEMIITECVTCETMPRAIVRMIGEVFGF
jgi:hypothetical protein